jgi:copper chaperone CopZ
MGMSCSHCAQAVEKAVKRVDGVRKVKVSLEEGTALITARDGVDTAAIVRAVREAGYEASARR